MKTLCLAFAIGFAAISSVHAAPTNTTCPVGGRPVKPGFVSTFKGKEYALCCAKCKAKFDASPAQYAK
jgi:YHS domain-containing protein